MVYEWQYTTQEAPTTFPSVERKTKSSFGNDQVRYSVWRNHNHFCEKEVKTYTQKYFRKDSDILAVSTFT